MATKKSARQSRKTADERGGTRSSTKRAVKTSSAGKKSATRKRPSATKKESSAGKTVTKRSLRVPPRSSAVSPKSAKKKLARYDAKRDFSKTAEPSGDAPVPKARRGTLRFVIQKHAASHLHYDFRLELDGVMKSWAVPKGPSVVPGVRRLAMEVEDHPISYNTFEGTIPAGQYGGGTVMLWDRGTYEAADDGGVEALRAGYAKGKLDIVMHGERLTGGFTLVRTRGDGERAQWLLIKRSGEGARRDAELTEEEQTSVVTGRTMEQITAGVGGKRSWRSNR